MDVSHTRAGPVTRLGGFVHHQLIWFLLASYALAAVAPAAGLAFRQVRVGYGSVHATLPSLLLALLLFNAGLGAEPRRLRDLVRRSGALAAGLFANVFVPLTFILGLSLTLRMWHNPTEVQSILVGLALIASMPIAGSSTAWTQNADGDMALSLGLVVGSTLLSPLTTPAFLTAVGWVATGEFAAGLQGLADGRSEAFLATFVMAPSLAGIFARCLVGGPPLAPLKPALKLVNSAAVLTLCYSNAAVALPQTIAAPDWDFLSVMLVIVTALCVTGFAAGGLLSLALGADAGRRASLMFGLGMTNNGTGLVLATTALAHLPDVLLPVIFYNLVQHVVAGVAARLVMPSEVTAL
jgi:BASS family bile acid:Na+ symporter